MGKEIGGPSHLPPSPPPPPPRRSPSSSYTRREIEKFWRTRRLVEEEHLLDAIKTAARRRARQLSEEEYRLFLESLDEVKTVKDDDNKGYGNNNNQEIRVGIKDWWTRSKYAYLNQPAVGTVRPNRRSNYKPNSMFMCNYKLMSSPMTATSSSKAAYLGVY